MTAGFVKGVEDSNGNIKPKGSNHNRGSTVEELSSHDEVRQAEIDGDTVVAELSGRIRAKEEGEKYLGVDLNSEHLDTFFTEEEIEELRKAESITSGKDEKDISDKSYDEIRNEMRQEVDEIYRQERKEHALKDAKRVEETRDWMRPAHESKKVSEMTGKEFKQAMSEAMSEPDTEEELAQHSEEDIEDILGLNQEPEIETLDSETEELAKQAFERRAKKKGKPAWNDIAEDLEMSNQKTQYESVGSNARKVTTEEAELKDALRSPDSGFEGKITILEDTDSVVQAIVEKEN